MTPEPITRSHTAGRFGWDAGSRPDPGPMLDAIAGSAARWFSVPRALILLDANRLDGLRCSYGVLDGWTEREAAICYHSFAPPETCVVENLAQDARFSGHPLVTSPSGIRFYAGSPIVGPEGPRQIRMLQDLAELTASYLVGWISSCRPLEDPLAFDAGERRYRELFENTTDNSRLSTAPRKSSPVSPARSCWR